MGLFDDDDDDDDDDEENKPRKACLVEDPEEARLGAAPSTHRNSMITKRQS